MAIRNKGKVQKKSGVVAIKDSSPTVSVLDKRPKFSLKYLEGKYCLSCCEKDDKAAFADTLHKLAKMTWQQIFHASRHGSGFEKIDVASLSWLSSPFRNKKIVAFRFSGLKPMLGFQDQEVFYILALDRDLTAYPH